MSKFLIARSLPPAPCPLFLSHPLRQSAWHVHIRRSGDFILSPKQHTPYQRAIELARVEHRRIRPQLAPHESQCFLHRLRTKSFYIHVFGPLSVAPAINIDRLRSPRSQFSYPV